MLMMLMNLLSAFGFMRPSHKKAEKTNNDSQPKAKKTWLRQD